MSQRIVYVLATAWEDEAPTVSLYTPEFGWSCWHIFCFAISRGRPVTCRAWGCDHAVSWHPATGFLFDEELPF